MSRCKKVWKGLGGDFRLTIRRPKHKDWRYQEKGLGEEFGPNHESPCKVLLESVLHERERAGGLGYMA